MNNPEVSTEQIATTGIDSTIVTSRGRMRFWQKALIISACMVLGTIAGATFFGILTGASPHTLWIPAPHSDLVHTQVTAIRVGLFSGLAGGLVAGIILTSRK